MKKMKVGDLVESTSDYRLPISNFAGFTTCEMIFQSGALLRIISGPFYRVDIENPQIGPVSHFSVTAEIAPSILVKFSMREDQIKAHD